MAVNIIKRTFLIFFFALISGLAQAQVTELTATVDKNPAMADEAIQLQVTANGDADREAFDPSPLLKDFVVGRTSVSSQTQIINFNTSRTTTWTTRLIPRQPGRYRIPAFTIDGVSSQPIEVDVIPVSAAARRQSQSNVFVTTDVDTDTLYLQQQFVYTAKLHLAIDLQRGSLAAPELQGADIRQLGKDVETTEIINGKRYRVITRNFAIIPQQSGQFTIAGPLFEGEVVDNTRQSFALFNRTKTISRVGEAIDINVLPIPANYGDHWLPSNLVQISQEWQPGPGEYRVGEPITRIITLTAAGAVEEQLPEIQGSYPNGLKVYPDQANSATVEHGNKLVAQRTESIALIPSQAGSFVLPAIEVPWFNVESGRTEFARLPSETINILPAVGDTTPAPAVLPPIDKVANTPEAIGGNTAATLHDSVSAWWSVSSYVLLGLWLFTLAMWWQARKKAPRLTNNSPPIESESEKQAWLALLATLKKREQQGIIAALTHWLGLYLQLPGASLQQCKLLIADDALDEEIARLLSSRYGKSNLEWEPQQLVSQLQRLRKQRSADSQVQIGLKPLYPQ